MKAGHPHFEAVVPLDCIKSLISNLRAGNFGVDTRAELCFVLGSLNEFTRSLPPTMGTASSVATESVVPQVGFNEQGVINGLCSRLEDLLTMKAADSTAAINPENLKLILEYAVVLLKLFMNK